MQSLTFILLRDSIIYPFMCVLGVLKHPSTNASWKRRLLCVALLNLGFYFHYSHSVRYRSVSRMIVTLIPHLSQILRFQMIHAVSYALVSTLGPRLILNLKEAYYAPYTEEFDEHWWCRVQDTVDIDGSCEWRYWCAGLVLEGEDHTQVTPLSFFFSSQKTYPKT